MANKEVLISEKMDRMRSPVELQEVGYGDVVSRYSGELGFRLATQGDSPERALEVIEGANAVGLIVGKGNGGDLAARPSPSGDGSMEVVKMSDNTFDSPNVVTLHPPAGSYATK